MNDHQPPPETIASLEAEALAILMDRGMLRHEAEAYLVEMQEKCMREAALETLPRRS